jgi:hypothetical protein
LKVDLFFVWGICRGDFLRDFPSFKPILSRADFFLSGESVSMEPGENGVVQPKRVRFVLKGSYATRADVDGGREVKI